jgi:hypothetical protein
MAVLTEGLAPFQDLLSRSMYALALTWPGSRLWPVQRYFKTLLRPELIVIKYGDQWEEVSEHPISTLDHGFERLVSQIIPGIHSFATEWPAYQFAGRLDFAHCEPA